MFGLKLFSVLLLIFSLTLTGTLVFLKGFLLSRTVVEKVSECNEEFAFKTDGDHSGHGVDGCWMHRRYKRAIIIVIDALKYDFISYNVSLKDGENDTPYKNRLKILYDLEKNKPLQAFKFKFIADPPTTTLQRLKGLTTGSLPTFVDAGANFHSSEINEDNIIDQMLRRNRKVKFLGDDTWMSLFPKRFYKHYEFPSFDVKDLHTVDNGILKHLYQELRKSDWDITIAHFLGVDHCGHRYGPNHEAMKDKLEQMNDVISNVTNLMLEDTVLFIMGDHGMTRTGDHGGDSADELEAGLFVYSPIPLINSLDQKQTSAVSQIDFVPTVSLLLGLPIPFSNLGMVIPDFFSPWWDADAEGVHRMHHRIKALRLNALQINRYLHAYQDIASDLPANTLRELQAQIRLAEKEFKNLVLYINSGGHEDSALTSFQTVEKIYKMYVQTAKRTCQEVWAKFDMKLVITGIVIILSGVCVSFFFALSQVESENVFSFSSLFLVGGALLLIIYVIAHACLFSESVPPVMAFILSLVIAFASLVCIKDRFYNIFRSLTQDSVLASILIIMYCCIFFSNSFVVYEDLISCYFLQTLIVFYSLRIASFYINLKKIGIGLHKVDRRVRKVKQRFDVMQFVSNPLTISAVVTFTCCALFRSTYVFYACREEQTVCKDSVFNAPLSAVNKAYINQRYMFSVVCLAVMVFAVRHWLKYYGNLTGSDAAVVAMRSAPPVAAVCIGLFWAVQAVPESALEALTPWQQALLAQLVYGVIGLALAVIILWPLLLYNQPTSVSPNAAILNQADMKQVIPSLYNQLRVQINSTHEDQKPPIVYGLGSVYSASQVAMVSLVSLVLALLLGDGVAPSITLAVITLYLCLELYSAVTAIYDSSKENSAVEGSKDEGSKPLLSGLVMLNLLSSTFFYATGHQATIPSIRFESAYTGFYGNFNNMILPGFLIWLNTFAGPLLVSLACPLLITWPALKSSLSRWMTGDLESRREDQAWQGDFKLFNDGIQLRKAMFQVCCGLVAISSCRLFSAACAAALHRRHLMIWKIFAPRLVYEAAFFITTSVGVMLAYMFVLRVDKALTRFVENLPSAKGEKRI